MIYLFANTGKVVDWNALLYFDIETVPDIETMKLVKQSNDLRYLDPAKAKYVSFAVHADKPKLHMRNFRSRLKGSWRLYYNTKEMNYKEIAEALLDSADKLGITGFCAHNGNRFDFLIFKHYKLVEHKGTLVLHARKKRYSLVDTARIGKALGVPALDEMAKALHLKGKNLAEANVLQEYCMNDTYVLCRIAEKLSTLGMLHSPTATARHYLCKELEKHGITTVRSSLNIPLQYIGGRIDIFIHYAKQCNVFDANSLYPSVMANMLYPAITRNGWIGTRKVSTATAKACIDNANARALQAVQSFNPLHVMPAFEKAYNGKQFICFVKLKGIKPALQSMQGLINMYFPFSYRDEQGRRLYNLNTSAVYQVQGYETLWLSLFNYEVLDARLFKAEHLPVSSFYRKLYNERQMLKAKGDARQMLLKIIMNSSYGILGMRVKAKHPGADTHEFNIAGKQFTTGKTFAKLSAPLLATHVTSCGRFYLQCMIFMLAAQGYKVYYCDTDSVFTDAPMQFIERQGLLGKAMLQVKLEKTIDNFAALAPKYYTGMVNGEPLIKCKGTGNAIEKQFVHLSAKHPEPTLINRKAYDPQGIPKKVPDKHFISRYNSEGLCYNEAYAELRNFAKQLYGNAIEL